MWERMPAIPATLFSLLGAADWIGYCWSNLPVTVLAAIDLLARRSCALKVTVIRPFSWMNDCEGTVILPKVTPAWVSVADCCEQLVTWQVIIASWLSRGCRSSRR